MDASSPAAPSRYQRSFDWLRIGAAVAVVLHHLTPLVAGRSLLPHAYLAVDLFFVISGFVVAERHEHRLRAGWPVVDFLKARLSRLLPLLLITAIVVLLEAGLRRAYGHTLSELKWLEVIGAVIASAFALPMPLQPLLGHGNWPLNPPLWSLFYELLLGVALAPWLLRLTNHGLVFVSAVSAAALAWFGLQAGSLEGGVFLFQACVALTRIGFSFTLGVLLLRRHQGHARLAQCLAPCAIGLLAAALSTGAEGGATVSSAVAIDLLFAFVAWPSLVTLGAAVEPAWPLPALPFLGALSYALYVLHWPLTLLLRNLARHLGWMSVDSPFTTGMLLLAVLLTGTVAVLWLEPPLRRRLSDRSGGTSSG